MKHKWIARKKMSLSELILLAEKVQEEALKELQKTTPLKKPDTSCFLNLEYDEKIAVIVKNSIIVIINDFIHSPTKVINSFNLLNGCNEDVNEIIKIAGKLVEYDIVEGVTISPCFEYKGVLMNVKTYKMEDSTIKEIAKNYKNIIFYTIKLSKHGTLLRFAGEYIGKK